MGKSDFDINIGQLIKEAKKRVRAKRETIIIERESSGSSSEDDIRDARVYTVRKSHSDTEQAKPPPTPPVEDDPLGDIALLYTIQACLFGHFEPAILSGRVGARD